MAGVLGTYTKKKKKLEYEFDCFFSLLSISFSPEFFYFVWFLDWWIRLKKFDFDGCLV